MKSPTEANPGDAIQVRGEGVSGISESNNNRNPLWKQNMWKISSSLEKKL